ncbi:MAG: aspartate aminotransferase family protein [Bauldia sp.]|nr:aspartate aminotransferase family protein [Bauldia sp.]
MAEAPAGVELPGAIGRDAESRRLLARASASIAKGASSTMRVLDYHLPLVVERAEGAVVWDADGNDLIDMNMGYGPLIFGHRPRLVTDAIARELGNRGTLLGFADTVSIEVAELIKAAFPSIDLLRFTSTGTEASQTAVRLARAFTGRSKLVLFEGCYHGSTDGTFHRYHAAPADIDALAERGEVAPGTGGMNGAPRDIVLVPFNDIEALGAALAANRGNVAAVMLEPVLGNAGVIAPDPGFLAAVATMARNAGALVVFDEVITGFRIARGGAQERYGVEADLTMLSKAASGGVPLGVIGGRADVMKLMVDGVVFHGGVYSGNPLSLSAALAVQREFAANGASIYARLEASASRLADGLRSLLRGAGIPAVVSHVGAMLSLWIARDDAAPVPRSYRDVVRTMDHTRLIRLQHAAQRNGVYFHPNHFEPWYISTAHTPEIVDRVLDRLSGALREVDWRPGG